MICFTNIAIVVRILLNFGKQSLLVLQQYHQQALLQLKVQQSKKQESDDDQRSGLRNLMKNMLNQNKKRNPTLRGGTILDSQSFFLGAQNDQNSLIIKPKKNGKNQRINNFNIHRDSEDSSRQDEDYSFPNIKASPSTINSYLHEQKHKQCFSNFMDERNQVNEHYDSRKASQIYLYGGNTSNMRYSIDPDRNASINAISIKDGEFSSKIYQNMSLITRNRNKSMISNPSMTSLQSSSNFSTSKKNILERNLSPDIQLMNQDSYSLSPNKLNLKNKNQSKKVQLNKGAKLPLNQLPIDQSYRDIAEKLSKSTIKDYQNLKSRHFPLIKPSINVSIDVGHISGLTQQDQLIFGDTKYDQSFLDSKVKSSLMLYDSIDKYKQNEDLSQKLSISPKSRKKEVTQGRFKIEVMKSYERAFAEKEWMKKVNPTHFDKLEKREQFEDLMILKQRKRLEQLNKQTLK
eukprot:403371405